MMSNTPASQIDDLVIAASRKEIVFIEDNVPDMNTLLEGICAGKEIVILDSSKDGLRQIADALAGGSGIDALHIVSHGVAGSVDLGALLLDANNLGAHSAELQAIRKGMAAGGDILLYGCDIGAGSAGQAFVEHLAIVTGADVAASSNLTGSAALGGDWNLEISSGHIETRAVTDASLAALYQKTLNITSATVDFDIPSQIANAGGNNSAQDDVIVKVNGDPNYLLKIDGATENVATYGAGYVASDSRAGVGETMLTFNFVGGQVFSPTSIDVANFQSGNTSQHLVFKAYDAANNYLGTRTGDTGANIAEYTTVSLAGLTNVAKLTLTGDPATNGGKLVYLVFDNFKLTNIQPAGPAPVAPAVTGVSSSTANGAYKAGATITLTVTFDRAVDVDTTGGTPTLQLETGSTDQKALYTGGSGTTTLSFAYTVQAGDTSANLNYLSAAALATNGATIKAHDDATGAALTLPATGGAGSLGASKAIVIDTTAPAAPGGPVLDTGADSGTLGDGITNRLQPTITGSGAEAGATIKLYDSNGVTEIGSAVVGGGGTWSIVPTAALASGAHSLTARATDAAGNVSAASLPLNLTIDTTPPTAPGAPDLAAADDSGDSSTDNITKAATTVFSGGAAEAGATIRLYDANGSVLTTTTADGSGNWSVPVALSEGAHAVTATATDSAGNESAPSPVLAVVVDRTAPVTMAASAVFSNDTGASPTDMVTSVANGQTVSGMLNANLAAGEHVEVSLDNGASWATATASAGSNTWSVAATLSASNTLLVRVVDTAGNAGTAYTRAYVLDNSAPSAPSTPDLDTASDSGTSHTDNVTGTKMPTFSGTAEAGATVTLYDGVTPIGAVTAAGDGKWQITSNIELGQGSHSITATATDVAGNTGASSPALSVFIETRTPSTGIASLAFSADTGSSATDLVTNMAAQTISGTLDANLASGERVEVSFDNGASWTAATTAVGSNAWSLPATLAAGTHTLQVRVANSVDNSGPVHSQTYTLDQAAPSVTIASDVAHLKAGETATVTFTFSEDPGNTFTWDGSTGDVVVSGGTLSAISGTGLVRTATFTPNANTNAGSASIRVATGAYRDVAGNDCAASNNLALGYDTLGPSKPSAPSLALNDDTGALNSDHVTRANPITLSGTAEVGVTVKLYDGGSVIASTTASGGSYSFTLTGLSEDNHNFAVVAVDTAGNESAVSDGLAVTIDRTPPSTTVASASLSADTGASSNDMVTKEASQIISGTLSAALESGEQVMVSLDNGASWRSATAGAGSTMWELAAVTLGGSDILKVKVVDLAGNDGAVYSHTYVLDQSAPAASSMPDLDAGSDSGASHTDNITGVTLPSFRGTAEVGAKVTLFDGGIEIGSTVATDGTWHITTSSSTPMNQRIHYITADVMDLAGNHAPTSPVLELDVRTAGPSKTVAGMALSSDSGTVGDFITNAAAQTLSGTLSTNLAVGERVQVSLDNGAIWTNATGTAGQDAWAIALTLAAGSHDIQVRVIDALDNFSAVHTQAYTLDAVKPSVAISSNVAQLKAGETATITFTFSEDPGSSFSWDGTAGNLSVSGGTLSALQGTGNVRTATFTPTANTDSGTASIAVNANSYQDLAGNLGAVGTSPPLSFDTYAPAVPSAPDLHKDSDSGALDTDNLTRDTALVFTGSAEAGATVKLYDTDGTTEIGHATAAGGNWTITTSTLLDGSHTITAKAFDAAGNVSAASGPLTVTFDRAKPAAMAAPAFKTGSDSGTAGDGITNVKKPTLTGSAEAYAQVTLYDGASVLGTANANAAGRWEFAPAADLFDGVHAISARQTDLAGNQSDPGGAFSLTVDTVAPAAPAAPKLAATSDTGTVGDGITETNTPVIEGTALANTLFTLYDMSSSGTNAIGSVMADGSGKWSIATTGVSVGSHSLSVTQTDAAGNESAHSTPFALRVDAPPVPVPVKLIDGLAVDIQPISLPGGVSGSAISIPVVSAGRVDSTGQPSVADIPLLTSSQGNSLLMASVPLGAGLSAHGASVPQASGAELLIAAIKAATPTHGATDQGHLTGNGQSFLDGLAAGGTLLVETVKPVSAAGAPDGVLSLSGPAQPQGQSTALVIDAGGLGAGATIKLQDVNFAAVIGAANVVSTGSMVLSGDAASQHFTVAAGMRTNAVLAGGGNDTLALAPPAAAGTSAGAVMLHGGSANDVAVFSGARADYDLAFHNAYVTVTSKSGPATTATVVNVETLQFSDGQVAVQNSANMRTLAGLYQTVLGRQADISGIEFWASGQQAGASWGDIALHMIASSERLASHEGFNGNATHDITMLYTALFSRAPDAAGLAFWVNAMTHGVSLEHIADEFVKSVEMVGHQRAALDWDFING
jgi:hypothetical protein